MVMISPCAGCDTPNLARILALFEAISGITTITKSAWWYLFFRIPVKKQNSAVHSKTISNDAENPEPEVGESFALAHENIPHPECVPFKVDPVQYEEVEIQPDCGTDDITDTESITSAVSEANADNVLWTITGLVMGTLNIALSLFLLLGLANVNYVFLTMWCLCFPIFYLLDCILFTFLLKHCTSKERFDRCRSHYISSTILSFVFNSYVLWVGISVIYWCNCRRDPYRCKFQRDYCHSFNLNFSGRGELMGDVDESNFYDLSEIYHPFETTSF